MTVILYSTNCPKCKVLGLKLKQKGIAYTEDTDIEKMQSLGLTSAPYLDVDGELMDFATAVAWVGKQ